jgi:hypothetical protein
MGVLSNVLNILNSESGADADNVHTDTQRVQRKRKAEGEDKKEKAERRAFRIAVGGSLTALAITSKEEALRKEEDKVERLQLALMEAEAVGDARKTQFYTTNLVEHHGQRIGIFVKEIAKMKKAAYGVEDDNKDDSSNGDDDQ